MAGDQQPSNSSKKLSERLDIDFALQATGLGVWEVDPMTNQVLWDDRCRELFGPATQNDLPYEQAIQYIHSDDVDRINQAVQWAMNPASTGVYDETCRIIGADDGKLRWVRFIGRSYFTPAGEVYRFAGVAQRVTQQVEARQREDTAHQAQRQQRIHEAIMDSTPDLIYVFDLSYRFVYANQALLTMWGSTWENSIGKGLLENGYEPWHAQMHEREIDQVVATKQPIRGEVSFPHATLGKRVYDYVFVPILNEAGDVEAVAGTTRDISDSMQVFLALQEAESNLRGAVEMAQLGTWSIDVATSGLTYSDRLIDWFGYDPAAQDYNQVIPILSAADQERVAAAVARALTPGSDGVYEETYTVLHPKTGQKRVLHAHGKTVFDASGKAVRLNGTARDITLQQEMQTALENEVQLRTEELAATNEELAASNEELAVNNEEYVAINEELEEANQLLIRSNDNLQQFAYVASHDLQEPLRKVQQFGDLLKNRYSDQLGDGVDYLERMQSAASRMSALIRDLLTFSRISNSQSRVILVGLNQVVGSVLTDLDLRLQETKAVVHVDRLPFVQGDPSQLAQLFQNLISNALKFQRADSVPEIRIGARRVISADLPTGVRPTRPCAAYHQIDITDNGIGFDEKYLDRIFQVFQRLHGKNEFAGTGIGLAICEKVVANHGGAITARSQPGQGATFSFYLPV